MILIDVLVSLIFNIWISLFTVSNKKTLKVKYVFLRQTQLLKRREQFIVRKKTKES